MCKNCRNHRGNKNCGCGYDNKYGYNGLTRRDTRWGYKNGRDGCCYNAGYGRDTRWGYNGYDYSRGYGRMDFGGYYTSNYFGSV